MSMLEIQRRMSLKMVSNLVVISFKCVGIDNFVVRSYLFLDLRY